MHKTLLRSLMRLTVNSDFVRVAFAHFPRRSGLWKKAFISILALLFTLPLSARAEVPPEIAPYIHAAEPYGSGTYSAYFINAYDATLWTDARPWSMKKPFALSLHYRMHFTAEAIASRSIKEMTGEEPLSDEKKQSYMTQLLKVVPEVKADDVITAMYMPGEWIDFYYQGKKTGRITDDVFAQRFLNIWLSEKTSAPDLRAKLVKE